MDKSSIYDNVMQNNPNLKTKFPTEIVSDISRRSELAQEIISHKPNFIEAWGLYIYICFLIVIFCCTWFVKYPDIIETKAILTANNAPKEVIAKQSGRLIKLFVQNNQEVSANELIGWIETTGNHAEVLELSRQIDRSITFLKLNDSDEIRKIFSQQFANLGELQVNYQQFIIAWQKFNDYKNNGFYAEKRNSLVNDIKSLEKISQSIEIQKRLTEKDVQLATESFKMNKILLDQKVLTKEEFRSQTSKYVNKQLAIPTLVNSILDNGVQTRSKLNEINQLDHDIAQEQIVFWQTLESLKSQVADWVAKYTVRAPVKGTIYFTSPIQENQILEAGKLLGYVNPEKSEYYAETNLSQNNFGKIDTGLMVQLRFDAYPYQEVGFVEGKLSYISNVPTDSGFRATIKLSNGFITNNHNALLYKNGLSAHALIITKNMRLLERIYYSMLKSFSTVGKK